MSTELLKKSLSFLKNTVNNYGVSQDIIEITNIATINDGDEFLKSKSPIILSIINIEEDKIAKNPNIYIKNGANASDINKLTNPAQNLIITLLFSAYNQEQKAENYENGLIKLEHVIRCFQEKNVFHIVGDTIVSPETPNHTKLILDLESLKFSELNQLWSMLGNKYMPSVCYKMRMISIQNEKLLEEKAIEEVTIELHDTPNKDNSLLIERIINEE
ncbi:DUF4255 domain-containing protein [Lutibacter citreus]|uniref:DUF4255 domain-containing protein n=1 Tax=Lutibacter citreus TaxID=2138210 RepID=UPI000DBE6715|nr:DUF4255 domain-containing protein [Lutibacter citreus]